MPTSIKHSLSDALECLNVVRDSLRVVNGVDFCTLYRIPGTLPVLIMPYGDNTPSARYVIPGWDGHV